MHPRHTWNSLLARSSFGTFPFEVSQPDDLHWQLIHDTRKIPFSDYKANNVLFVNDFGGAIIPEGGLPPMCMRCAGYYDAKLKLNSGAFGLDECIMSEDDDDEAEDLLSSRRRLECCCSESGVDAGLFLGDINRASDADNASVSAIVCKLECVQCAAGMRCA